MTKKDIKPVNYADINIFHKKGTDLKFERIFYDQYWLK